MVTVKQTLISDLVNSGMSDSQALEVVNITKKEMGNDLRLEDDVRDYNKMIIQLWITSTRKCALIWINKNKPKAWFKPMFYLETN